MKKIFIAILGVLVLGNSMFAFAYDLNDADVKVVNSLVVVFEKAIEERQGEFRNKSIEFLSILSLKYENTNPRYSKIFGVMAKLLTIEQPIEVCLNEGEYVLLEEAYCCVGLESFSFTKGGSVDQAGQICYDPDKGTPECRQELPEGPYFEAPWILYPDNSYLNGSFQCVD